MPRPLKKERGVLITNATEHLRKLWEEVKLLFPEGLWPGSENPHYGPYPVHTLSDVRFTSVEQPVRLSVGATDHLHGARLNGRP